METTQNLSLSFGQSFKKLLIDFTSVFFAFHILRFSVSYLGFIPYLPGFLIMWLLYNIISLGVWKQTLGSAFFGASLANLNNKKAFHIRIVMREIFISLPGSLLIIYYLIRYLPANLGDFPLYIFIIGLKWGGVIILILLLFVAIFKVKIFQTRMLKNTFAGRTNHLKRTRKWCVIVYLLLLLFAAGSRYFHTSYTNDVDKVRLACEELPFKPDPHGELTNLDWGYYTAPRPSVQSVQEYIDYLKVNRKDINDYIFSLFDKYDHVILCERIHTEMTQYDMIYNLVTDDRFVEKVGNVFTEIGNVDSREAYRKLTDSEFPNDTLFQQALSSFMMENQTYHLFWSSTNWFYFLEKMARFNHKKEKKVEILFTDRANWIYHDRNYNRDSLMASNIISTIKEKRLNKSLIIMNYRHAYLRNEGNCGYHISECFQGKVANVLINTADLFISPFQHGKWDVAFEQMPEKAFAFNFKDSPFGKDRFDHYAFFSRLSKLRYEDMFTGFIYYKPLYLHYIGYGFPYSMQPENVKILKERAHEMGEIFNEEVYNYSSDRRFKYSKFIYYGPNLLDNIFFVWNLIWGVGILLYLGIVYVRMEKS